MKQFVVLCVLALSSTAFADIGIDLQNANGYDYSPPPNPMYLPPEIPTVVETTDSCPPIPPPIQCPAPPPPVVCPKPPPPPPPCPVCPPPPPPVVCPKPPAPKPCECEKPNNEYLPPPTEYLPPGKRFRKL